MEIILLRHGKPKVDLSGYLSVCELKQLIKAYEKSSIQDSPSKQLINHFKSYFIVCSDLNRSLESAKKLGFKKIHLSDDLFRETDIPFFNKNFIKLPVSIWVILLRILWLFGFSKNGESFSQSKIRSKDAAEKLIELAQKNKKILVVGHGLMNRLIGRQLEKEGWQGTKKKGKGYWEQRRYTFSGSKK